MIPMKNLLIPMTFMLTMMCATAQQGQRPMKDVTPEQLATVKSQELTLALDLSDKQQQEVKLLLLEESKERMQQRLTREERRKLTAEQKMELKEQRLNQQIAMKRSMKEILDDEQYTRFEKMMVRRKGKRMARFSKKKDNRFRRG
jgi:DNA-binding helix-hairpin-helix protein with protein kinase domain